MRIFVVATTVLLSLTLFLCSRDEPHTAYPFVSNPELVVPLLGDSSLMEELVWSNVKHEFFENHPYDTLTTQEAERLKKVVILIDKHPNKALAAHRARAQRLLAANLINLDRNEEALLALNESLQQLEEFESPDVAYQYERSYHHNLIGIIHELDSDIERALVNSQRAEEIAEEYGLMIDVFKEALHQASIYQGLGRKKLEARAYQKASRLIGLYKDSCVSKNDQSALVLYDYNKGKNGLIDTKAALFSGDTTLALELGRNAVIHFDKAYSATRQYELSDSVGKYTYINYYVLQIGNILPFDEDIVQKAQIALEELEKGQFAQSLTFNIVAMLFKARTTGRCPGAASPFYEAAVKYVEGTEVVGMTPRDALGRASLARILALYECECGLLNNDSVLKKRADRRALSATEDYETFVNGNSLEANIENLGGDWISYYADAMDTYLRSSEAVTGPVSNSVLRISDGSKGLALRLSFEERINRQRYGKEYANLIEQKQELESKLRKRKSAGDLEGERRLQARLQEFVDSLSRDRSPEAVRFIQDNGNERELTVEEIQRNLLDEGSAAFDVFFGKAQLIISVITKTDSRQFIRPISAELLQTFKRLETAKADDDPSNMHLGYTLYQEVYEEALEWLRKEEGVSELMLVTHPSIDRYALGYIPTTAPSGLWSSNPMVMDEYSVVYGYKFSSLLAAHQLDETRETSSSGVGGFLATADVSSAGVNAPDLPLTEEAIKTFMNGLPSPGDLYPAITPGHFLEAAPNYRHLVIGAHGYSLPPDNEEFYLQLNPDDSVQDGRLTNADLYQVYLPAELTLLFNCESANGPAYNSEGRKSLSRSFLYAGSSAVIAGNDQLVDNVLGELIPSFENYWITEGLSASQALRQAKLDFRSKFPEVAPYAWGNLVYYGKNEVYYSGK